MAKKPKDEMQHIEVKKGDLTKAMLKGWLINSTAPGVILFWGAAALHLANEDYTVNQKLIFFTAAVTIVFAADIGKAFTAQKLKEQWLKPSVIHLINKLSGAGMIIFGVYMVLRGFY
jgi:threonine/homoserine/homoserine lactone efflux protein